MGLCPICEAIGPTGQACASAPCTRLGVHMVPDAEARRHKALPVAQVEPLVGTFVGEFLVLRKLGRGGFGRVLLGLQRPLYELHAAIKLLDVEALRPADRSTLIQKFEYEARTLARLRHPNIVGLLQYGTTSGQPFLAMEFVPGSRTLGTEVRTRAVQRAGFDIATVCRVVDQILRALEIAHNQGIIHRDIKPDNIMLEEVDGDRFHVKLVDFGLAKSFVERQETSHIAGTLSYMPPEQLTARNLGPWSDLYAVGVITFELVTGRRLFPEPQEALLAHKHDPNDDPIGRRKDVELPASLVAFFRRAIAHAPDDRFRSAAEFRVALATIAQSAESSFDRARDFSDLIPSNEISHVKRELERLESERRLLQIEREKVQHDRVLLSAALGSLSPPPLPVAHEVDAKMPSWFVGDADPVRRRARWPLALGALVVLGAAIPVAVQLSKSSAGPPREGLRATLDLAADGAAPGVAASERDGENGAESDSVSDAESDSESDSENDVAHDADDVGTGDTGDASDAEDPTGPMIGDVSGATARPVEGPVTRRVTAPRERPDVSGGMDATGVRGAADAGVRLAPDVRAPLPTSEPLIIELPH